MRKKGKTLTVFNTSGFAANPTSKVGSGNNAGAQGGVGSAGSSLDIDKILDDFFKEIEKTLESYLRKDKDDRSSGLVASDKGFEVGTFVTGMIGGSGAKTYLDENDKSILEIDKIQAREELIVPTITFNSIEVVSGDKANTFAYGRIKEVAINKDGSGGVATLDLLEEEYGTVKVNDILRGVFHNIEGGNESDTKEDQNGFFKYSGFFTSYFTPTKILENESGKMSFRYSIQPGTDRHPCAGMNFYAYGNFIDENRQTITYETRDYRRRLVKMNTWDIQPTKNIAMQDGKLDNLVIGGFKMSGYGTFQTNSYFTGVQIEFTPDQLEGLTGEDAYSVTLSSYEGLVRIDPEGNIVNGLTSTLNVVTEGLNVITEDQNVVTTDYILTTSIQAAKGQNPLFYSTSVEAGAYIASIRTIGCIGEIQHGQLVIKEITDINNCRATVTVNCEGKYSVEKEYNIKGIYDGSSSKIETIYSKKKNPENPEEVHPYEDNEEWNHAVSEDNIWMAMATKENENWTPWQVTRVKGYDAVEYRITPENTSIKMTMTGSLTPSKFNLTCYRIVGDERVAVEAQWLYQRSVTGVQWTDKKLFKDGFYTNIDFPISDSSYYEKGYSHYRFFAVPKEYDKYEATAFATVIEDGANGQMPRYRGIYKQGEEYVWDETYRDIMIYQGNAYQVASFGDVIKASSRVPDLSKWNQASKFDFVAMNTALIHEANIAGFTFFLDGYDDFGNPVGRLESQNGKIVLDSKNGKAKISGDLYASTLSFDSLSQDDEDVYILPEIKGRYGMMYFDNCIGISRSVRQKTYKASGSDQIVRITGSSTVSNSTTTTINKQETIIFFSMRSDFFEKDVWTSIVLPYWIYDGSGESVGGGGQIVFSDGVPSKWDKDVLYVIG